MIFYFFANPYRPKSLEAARALFQSLCRRGARIYADPWLAGQGIGGECGGILALPRDTKAVVCFGGDGTLLRAAPQAAEKGLPLLGVHTGTVGFLMPGDPMDPEGLADLLMNDACGRASYAMLEVFFDSRRFLCLNDVSVTRGEHPGVIETEVYADEELIFAPRGDGVVISTPLGSTAYALSAGGPMIRPDVNCLAVVPLNPRELQLRPVLLPPSARISLCLHGSSRRRLQLALDGQTLLPLESEAAVRVSTARERITLLSPAPPQFFHTLRKKQSAWNRQEE